MVFMKAVAIDIKTFVQHELLKATEALDPGALGERIALVVASPP
jgi:hypothetical protein